MIGEKVSDKTFLVSSRESLVMAWKTQRENKQIKTCLFDFGVIQPGLPWTKIHTKKQTNGCFFGILVWFNPVTWLYLKQNTKTYQSLSYICIIQNAYSCFLFLEPPSSHFAETVFGKRLQWKWYCGAAKKNRKDHRIVRLFVAVKVNISWLQQTTSQSDGQYFRPCDRLVLFQWPAAQSDGHDNDYDLTTRTGRLTWQLAESARSGKGAASIAKDLIDSADPKHTLFCREIAFVAIYALFQRQYSHPFMVVQIYLPHL